MSKVPALAALAIPDQPSQLPALDAGSCLVQWLVA